MCDSVINVVKWNCIIINDKDRGIIMKKYILTTATLIAALSLTACGTNNEKNTKETEVKTKQTETKTKDSEVKMPKVNDEEKAKEDATIFTGVLREDAKEAGSTIILNIGEAVGIDDKADIVKIFSESGVIINAEADQLGKNLTYADFKAGQKVKVKIQGTAPMTRSLPPQLPGSALISIAKID